MVRRLHVVMMTAHASAKFSRSAQAVTETVGHDYEQAGNGGLSDASRIQVGRF